MKSALSFGSKSESGNFFFFVEVVVKGIVYVDKFEDTDKDVQ